MRSLQLPVSRAPRRSRPRRVLLPAGAPRAASAAPAAAAAPTMLFALREAPAVSLAKSSLLSAIAGLDRGAAATPSDVAAVDAAIAALEAAGAAEEASAAPLDTRLAGKWRLVYSSTFAGVQAGSQGFRGPPGGGTPVRLGPVYQRIQPNAQRLDNILELVVPGPFFIGSLTVTATLSHLMRVTGERSIRIDFTKVTLRTRGLKGAHPVTLPSPLKALGLEDVVPPELRGGSFDTTFLDSEMRLSRGDRGETRVFIRA